ncbi:alpha/beta fold hydrolase [Tomitella biformata]|uniref:alpha/beta fold hydrolase n=1 Tax=Tomitella biformata TaxID=630403 RepID=UPI0011DCF42F|nr:alpha/beta hydrolase [Tomitella biformata]
MRTGIVLIHGGQHTGQCWQPTVDYLRRVRPDVEVLAVDLPGRGDNPADLASVGIAECVASAVADIEGAGLTDIVLAAHSMGGVTLPGVAAKLGADRVAHLVFIAAAVPPEGWSIADNLTGALQEEVLERVSESAPPPAVFPRELAEQLFCNGMSAEQVDFVVGQMCPESSLLATQRVDRTRMPASIPRTWVLTAQDRAVAPAQQRRHIENLGGVGNIVEIDTCHDVMVSEPAALGEALLACLP